MNILTEVILNNPVITIGTSAGVLILTGLFIKYNTGEKKKLNVGKNLKKKYEEKAVLKDIFSTFNYLGGSENSGRKKKDSPFSSSYYYAHNNSANIGGYSDGLRMEDYTMNHPRLLSKNGTPVDCYKNKNSVKKKDIVILSEKKNEKNSISFKHPSVSIKNFGWEDNIDVCRIRIEKLPSSRGDDFLTWEELKIAKSQIKAQLLNPKELNILMSSNITRTTQNYHLHLCLWDEIADLKIIWKQKKVNYQIIKSTSEKVETFNKTTLTLNHPIFHKSINRIKGNVILYYLLK